MKKLIWIICTAIIAALLLCSCDKEEVDRTVEKVADTAETIASEVKDNVDGMLEDGTVNDGDGYIGDQEDTSVSTAAPTDENADYEATEDDSLIGTDAGDTGEHM